MPIQRETIDIDSDFSLESVDDSILNSIDQKAIDDKIGTTKKSKDYVNNKELYNEFLKYRELKREANAKGLPDPQMPHKIAVACMQISRKFCSSYRYFSYSQDWKEEMVQDAICTCAEKAMKFDPDISQNPFSYITQIVFNAVTGRLNTEAKKDYINLKMYDEMHGYSASDDDTSSDENEGMSEVHDIYRDRLDRIGKYEERFGLNKERKVYERKIDENIIQLDL